CGRDARLLREHHQLSDGNHAYFLHHAGAMGLDRAKRDTEFHRADPHWYIAVPGDKDDLLHSAFLRELPLEAEAVRVPAAAHRAQGTLDRRAARAPDTRQRRRRS